MSSSQRAAVISFVVVLLTGLIVAGAVVLKPNASTGTSSATNSSPGTSLDAASSSSSTPSTPEPSSTQSNTTGNYKDGTYTTTIGYDTPDGIESMGVSITVANDIVTNSSVTEKAKGRESRAYQRDFIASYSSSVKGKKLAGLRLGIVAGASLTTAGFNDALDTLRAQAQS